MCEILVPESNCINGAISSLLPVSTQRRYSKDTYFKNSSVCKWDLQQPWRLPINITLQMQNETQRKATGLRVDGLPKSVRTVLSPPLHKSVPRGVLSSLNLWAPRLLELRAAPAQVSWEQEKAQWWALCWAWEPRSKSHREQGAFSARMAWQGCLSDLGSPYTSETR